MSNRLARWPKSFDGIRREIPGLVNGVMLDSEVDDKGIKFFPRGSQSILCFRSWEQIFSIDRQLAQTMREIQKNPRISLVEG